MQRLSAHPTRWEQPYLLRQAGWASCRAVHSALWGTLTMVLHVHHDCVDAGGSDKDAEPGLTSSRG